MGRARSTFASRAPTRIGLTEAFTGNEPREPALDSSERAISDTVGLNRSDRPNGAIGMGHLVRRIHLKYRWLSRTFLLYFAIDITIDFNNQKN
jgi:hypothetical protein